jgi:hypothetical protein
MSEAREALRKAITAVQEVEADLAKSTEALDRSRTMQAAAEEELAGFAYLDGRIATHHSSRLKAAIAAGEGAPDFGVLPKDLQSLRTKRGTAIEKVEAIRRVTGELEADRQRSEKLVERRKYELDLAVEKVVAASAATLANIFVTDFRALVARHRELAVFLERRVRLDPDMLQPSHAMPMGGYRAMEFPAAVHDAVRGCGLSGGEAPQTAERALEKPRAAVGAFIQRLRQDHEATF